MSRRRRRSEERLGATEVLIVDGYNVAHAWPELRALLDGARLDEARRRLVSVLSEYVALRGARVIVVFDGPEEAAGAARSGDGVEVRFSGAAQSADHVIERLAYEASRAGVAATVVVVTGDRLQRDLVRAMGAVTMGAADLLAEVEGARSEAAQRARRSRDVGGFARRLEHQLPPDVAARLEALRRGRDPFLEGGARSGEETADEPGGSTEGGPDVRSDDGPR